MFLTVPVPPLGTGRRRVIDVASALSESNVKDLASLFAIVQAVGLASRPDKALLLTLG
jgi:hypothetical protein